MEFKLQLCYNIGSDMTNPHNRPPKIKDIISAIGSCLEPGRYRRTAHQCQRENERNVDLTDVKHVLRHGRRETAKDEFSEEFNTWKYAMRGKTVDGLDVRVIVAFDENIMHIITVINLTEG